MRKPVLRAQVPHHVDAAHLQRGDGVRRPHGLAGLAPKGPQRAQLEVGRERVRGDAGQGDGRGGAAEAL
eukprot:CAMPEP_0181400686 /NCGR_PEP_ID=MMETSP1110-20121109/2240_1 /TAXON_ID=174948 /ORGANISM="Symbiodinium sp., Strain CCMP421" /LENGTH=68 /DNA_ID=CAMNT_0023522787 /DNA_START=251 /DNA_END=454 /DNA_ORIENTATION=-